MRPLADIAESAAPLDGLGKKVGKAVRGAIKPGTLKDAISGTWLGHALRPVLTDVVIGSFTSATLLDLLGGDDDGTAAERLIGVGIAAYAPTPPPGGNGRAPPGRPPRRERLGRLGAGRRGRTARRARAREHERARTHAVRILARRPPAR